MKKKTEITVISRDGKHKGKFTGGNSRPCSMEGCCGERVGVRWEDGKLTFPCTADMTNTNNKDEWRLI